MADEPLLEPPVAGTEVDSLLGALERNRRVLAWKCADLDGAGMATRVGVSSITLGGLLRHLTRAEHHSFEWKLFDRSGDYADDDWSRDWVFAPDDDAAKAVRRDWESAVEHSRDAVRAALADGGLDRAAGHAFDGWGTPSLRRILVDMIEEYARHAGHADLIRETIDGRVGEDVPDGWSLS